MNTLIWCGKVSGRINGPSYHSVINRLPPNHLAAQSPVTGGRLEAGWGRGSDDPEAGTSTGAELVREMAAATAVSSAKRSLRAELKQRLRAMSAEERLRQSRLLAQKVIAHSQYQKSKRISIFLSMQDEVETEEIIRDIFRQGKTCFVPRYRFQNNHMDMLRLTSPDEISLLPRTSWNILQPGEDEVREEALSTGGLDLIFVPGLGFDKHGNRLGRGKGYYDSYLTRCLQQRDSKPYTVALAFREQMCLRVPVDEHDVRVDEVLYEDST